MSNLVRFPAMNWGWTGLVVGIAGIVGLVSLRINLAGKMAIRSITIPLAKDVTIHGTVYEPATGDLCKSGVVVVPGTAASRQSCELGVSVPLACQGYRVLAIDPCGHGQSGGSQARSSFDYGLANFRQGRNDPAIAASMEFLRSLGCEKLALVGHSRGGWVATATAATRPDVEAAISIGAAPLTALHALPKNFLLLTGAADVISPRQKCLDTMAAVVAQGTSGKWVQVPWATHLTELADPRITRQLLDWLRPCLGGAISPCAGRLSITLLANLATLSGFFAASVWMLFGWRPPESELNDSLSRSGFRPQSVAQAVYGTLASSATGQSISRQSVPALVFLVMVVALVPCTAALSPWIDVGPTLFACPCVVLMALLGLAAWILGRAVAESAQSPWRPRDIVLGASGLLLAGLWLGLPLSTWMNLVPTGQRLLLVIVLGLTLFPPCLVLATAIGRMRGKMNGAGLWCLIPLALIFGYVSLGASRWPLFLLPVLFLGLGFTAALPLWLLPSSSGTSLARAINHAGATAWIMACQLPFVNDG